MVQAMKRQKIQNCLISRHLGQLLPLLLAGLLMSLAGCGRAGYLDEKERGNRILTKAYEMVDLGDYKTAVMLFRKVLDSYPTLARPHLDLALVLHERENDYLRAIYHYQRYLELRPSTEKDEMIQARIQQAERAFVASRVTVSGADGRTAMQLLEENSSLRTRMQSLEKTVSAQETELQDLREAERRRLRDQVMAGGTGVVSATVQPVVAGALPDGVQPVDRATLEPVSPPVADPVRPPVPVETVTRPVVPRVPVESVPSPVVPRVPVETVTRPVVPRVPVETVARPVVPEVPVDTSLRMPSRSGESRTAVSSNATDEVRLERSYTVQRGDTLSRIAYKVYGDATLWRGIQEANSAVLGDSVNVRVGQVLVIP
jgi:nucleoid-associated protein YgaU